MSGLLSSHIEDRLEVLADLDPDALVSDLAITTAELLSIPEFRNRAIQWIMENTNGTK